MTDKNQDPLKSYGEQLKKLVLDNILTVVDSSRQTQLVMALRNELYWRAKQYLTFKNIDGGIALAPIGPPGSKVDENSVSPQKSLSYTFNITRSDGQKFIAVVGQRQPYVNVAPKDANNPESIAAAADADSVTRYLEDTWDTRSKQKDVARTIWRSGPQFGRLIWRQDEKHGQVELADTEVVDQQDPYTLNCSECGYSGDADSPTPQPCPQCGNPATTVTGGSTYKAVQQLNQRKEPIGMPELELSNIFETTIPPQCTSLKTAPWLVNEKLTPSGVVKQQLGDLVRGITDEHESGPNVPSQEIMRDHYDLIASNDLEQQNRGNLWWVTGVWLRPEMYHYADSELRKILQQQYPNGARITFVNMKYVESAPEALTDVWFACRTGTDDRIVSDPICHDLVPINQIINNFFNLAIETMLRSIPKTIVSSRLVDRKAISSNEANVAEVLFANTGIGEDLSKMMAKLLTASIAPEMSQLADMFRPYSREMDGVLEAIFGGGEAAPTWRQDQQRKNQALAQFYIAFDEMRAFWVEVHRGAHKMLQQYGVGVVEVDGDDPFQFEPRKVDLSTLRPELIRVEAEEKMPMTRAEEADELRAQFADPPQIQEMNGLFHPLNVPRIVSMTQLRGMHSAMADLTLKSLNLIRQLLQEQPVEQFDDYGAPVLDPMTGEPAATASMNPDPFEFKNASFVVEVFRSFVNSRAGQEYAIKNPDGFKNVRLFGNALEQLANAQAMPQPAPGQAPPPAPGPQDQPVAA